MDKLAVYGGKPVREKPFPPNLLGVTLTGDEELKELKDVVAQKSPFRHYGLGKPEKVAAFEEEVKKYFGCKYALAVSSGSAALLCAMAALEIGPGDEVILTGFGWYSDYCAVVNMGALPVFADIDETLCIDPKDFERKITPKTKAVIVIDYQGCPAEMDEILSIAKTRGIKVIEDCAQAFGGEYKGKKLGTMGDITIASFQNNKMITCGEGGLVFTNNEEYFVRAVRYQDLGFVRAVFERQLENKALADPSHSFAGLQFRMSELQGAFILAQFRKLDIILEKCRNHHKRIRDHFASNDHFVFRYADGDCGITLFMLFKTAEEALKFSKCLEAEGIPVGSSSYCLNMLDQYPIKTRKMVHGALQPFGRGFEGEKVIYESSRDCPSTNGITSRYIAIGIGPMYSDEDVGDIIKAIEKVDSNLYA